MTKKCTSCARGNRQAATFCRYCGAALALEREGADPTLSQLRNAELAPDSSSKLDEQAVFIELCWLCGLPIAVSVVHNVASRIAGASAQGEVLAVATMAAVAFYGAARNGRLVVSALRWPKLQDLLVTLLVAMTLLPSLLGGFWILRQLGFYVHSGYPAGYQQAGWPRWVGIGDVAVLTPIAEEVLFRGLVQPKLGQLLTSTEALIVQAALFSALHLSPFILVTHFVIGLSLGWVRRRSGSLFPGMLLHAAWNAFVVLTTV